MKKKKAVLIFDLDRTLFDTAAFMRDNFAMLKKIFGIPKRHALAVSRERFLHEPFHPKKYIDALITGRRERKKALVRFLNLLSRSERYWYDGVHALLKALKAEFALVLLTYGTAHYQELKINNRLFRTFFDRVIVTQRKDKEKDLKKIKRLFSSAAYFFFDDKPVALASARRLGIRAFKVRKSHKDARYFQMIKNKILRAA